jgi:hypothetical protein
MTLRDWLIARLGGWTEAQHQASLALTREMTSAIAKSGAVSTLRWYPAPVAMAPGEPMPTAPHGHVPPAGDAPVVRGITPAPARPRKATTRKTPRTPKPRTRPPVTR